MDTCNGLASNGRFSVGDFSQRTSRVKYQFKREQILDADRKQLASEVLLSCSPGCGCCQNGPDWFNKRFTLQVTLQQLNYLSSSHTEKKDGLDCFINIERNLLCEPEIISRLTGLFEVLAGESQTLVVEVTERRHCDECRELYRGLDRLKQAGVGLALDDYDPGFDFRRPELKAGLYDFVKVDNPYFNLLSGSEETERWKDKICTLEQKLDARWIVERVDSFESFSELQRLPFWGYQGYLFA